MAGRPGRLLLFLVEAAGDQVLDRGERGLLVFAGHGQRDPRPLRSGQQEDPQDALAVDLLAVLADLDLRLEPAGRLDELGRGASVESEAVANGELALNHESWFSDTTSGATSSASRSEAT